VWSCAGESSHGNQRLGRVEDGHNYRMGTCGTRLELPSEKRKVGSSTLPLTTSPEVYQHDSELCKHVQSARLREFVARPF
jgi:hypothetical protein